MISDPISKRAKSGTISYMRGEMIPLLEAVGKEWAPIYISARLVCMVF